MPSIMRPPSVQQMEKPSPLKSSPSERREVAKEVKGRKEVAKEEVRAISKEVAEAVDAAVERREPPLLRRLRLGQLGPVSGGNYWGDAPVRKPRKGVTVPSSMMGDWQVADGKP